MPRIASFCHDGLINCCSTLTSARQAVSRIPINAIANGLEGIMSPAIEQILQQPEGKTLEFNRDLSAPHNVLKTLVSAADIVANGYNLDRKNPNAKAGLEH